MGGTNQNQKVMKTEKRFVGKKQAWGTERNNKVAVVMSQRKMCS